MRRPMKAALAAAAVLIPATAWAQASPGFDVDAATRAYLALLDGPARAKSDAYFEGGYWLPLWSMLVGVAVYVVLMAAGWSVRFRDWAERRTQKRWLVPALYALPFTIATTLLLLPWAIYSGFVREAQYDLMNQSFGAWLGDQGKGLIIGLILNPLMFMAIYAVIRRFPRRWWLLGTGVFAAFIALAVVVTPVFIAPLFNTYTELPAGPLRDRIVAVAAANDIPAQHIYVSDASRQTKRISANVSGMGPTIRITLNDNLLNRTSPDEVLAVMGHEMGHYVLGHIWRSLILLMLVSALLWFAVAKLGPRVLARWPGWGVRDVADPAGAPVLFAIASVGALVMTPVLNTIIRTNEVEADAFGLDAARQPDGFARVAMLLSEYRKISPGPVEEVLFFDHPSGENRVRMSMQWKKDHVPNATIVQPRPLDIKQ